MEKKIKQFTDLIAWQEGHKLVILIYQMTKKFPKEELFGLASQMNRSAVSITSNIAEGFGRQGYKEKLQFNYIAQGSLIELTNQLFIARDVKLMGVADSQKIEEQIKQTHKLLQGLISKTKSFLIPKS